MDNAHFKFLRNDKCEYFPCHKGGNIENFNCLFCYCPLYTLGSECGGNYKYLEDGTKDCSECIIPHGKNGFDHIIKKYDLVKELAKQNR